MAKLSLWLHREERDAWLVSRSGLGAGTQVAGGAKAALGSLRGTNVAGQDLRSPLPAQSAGGNHEMLIMPFLQAYYQSGSEGQRVDDPLRALTGLARHGLVTVEIDGQTMVITDIMMRMLHWTEGARSHGFDPASLMHEVDIPNAKGKLEHRRPNNRECGHLIGNSVPPYMVELLSSLNSRHELVAAAE